MLRGCVTRDEHLFFHLEELFLTQGEDSVCSSLHLSVVGEW